MQWHDTLAWALQLVGMSSAAWGLYSNETTHEDSKGRRHLTIRGWLALLAVVSGGVGLAVNQYRDHQASEAAQEAQARAEHTAEAATRALTELRAHQDEQSADLKAQLQGQVQQNAFFRHLSLVQQELAGLELSWDAPPALSGRVATAIRRAIEGEPFEGRWMPQGNDVYLEPCIRASEFTATRRPNYTWRVDCRVLRPQGLLGIAFELPIGERRTVVFDRFLDAVLSPSFEVRTGGGDSVAVLNTSARPRRVTRQGVRYTFGLDQTGTRFSTLQDAALSLRMDYTDPALAPSPVRIRSLDPLAPFDQQVALRWDLSVVETLQVPKDADDPESGMISVPRRALLSRPIPLRVDFTPLLSPVGSSAATLQVH